MSTVSLAFEFAGLAAQEIVGHLGLAESKASEAFRLIRESCAAAILSVIIRKRCDGAVTREGSE